jgi:hypothetical protein
MRPIHNLICVAHAGIGVLTPKTLIELPPNIYVAFYVPPGRQLDAGLAHALYRELAQPSALATMETLSNWHYQIRVKAVSVKIEGKTPPSSLELYPELDF